MLQDFKAFIMRGNVIDMAVGIIVGIAFGLVVNSLVKDVIMPPIGLALGNVDFANLFVVLKESATTPGPYASLAAAQQAGAVTINYGVFINAIVNLLIIAAVVFFLIVRPIAKLQARTKKVEAPTTKECPYCITAIPIKATRCPNCTSELKTA
jgi:large conductance mechanosensitive channel